MRVFGDQVVAKIVGVRGFEMDQLGRVVLGRQHALAVEEKRVDGEDDEEEDGVG